MRDAEIIPAAIIGCSLLSACVHIGVLVPEQGPASAPHALNSLVTELLELESVSAKPPYREITFTNPREGWVFLSATTRSGRSNQAVTISDWADSSTPGGPFGQEILHNFVEVLPYYWD